MNMILPWSLIKSFDSSSLKKGYEKISSESAVDPGKNLFDAAIYKTTKNRLEKFYIKKLHRYNEVHNFMKTFTVNQK